nr:hypothetical protein [Tanacetum cinerariifolium]
MINSIQNGDQPLPVIAQVSLVGTAHNVPPTLKDAKFWTAKEENTQKIDRLGRSLLIQRIPNDIYSLINSNETAKDLWDALVRQMRSSEYGEQDRKAAIMYEYETFKAIEGEQLLDTYLRYLQVINDLKKCGYNCYVNDALGYKKKTVVVTSYSLALVVEKTNITALLVKAFNQRKFYSKPTNNNLRTSSTSQSTNKKQEFVKTDDKKVEKKVEKKADEKKRDMSKVKCCNCKKEGHFAKDCKKAKVLSESDESSSSAEETITDVAYYTSKSESESELETSEYYDNFTNYSLFVNNDDDQEIFHDAIESASENLIKNHIDSQKDYDKSEVDHNDSCADNRPSMLEKDMYDSWKSRMELYMLNRPHGRMILESVEQGPLIWPSVEVEGVTRLKKYSKLSAAEAIQADCDVKATVGNKMHKAFPLLGESSHWQYKFPLPVE